LNDPHHIDPNHVGFDTEMEDYSHDDTNTDERNVNANTNDDHDHNGGDDDESIVGSSK